MTDYITTILFIGAFAFILETILSCSQRYTKISSAIKLLYSLCIFSAVIMPITSIRLDFSDFKTSSEQPDGHYSEEIPSFNTLLKNEIEYKITKEIFEKFGIHVHKISIELSEQNDISPQKITIILNRNNKANKDDIEKHIKSLEGFSNCPVTISTQG